MALPFGVVGDEIGEANEPFVALHSRGFGVDTVDMDLRHVRVNQSSQSNSYCSHDLVSKIHRHKIASVSNDPGT